MNKQGSGKEASDNESNCSDGELWLCAGQKRFSRRSKRMSNKEIPKKSQNVIPPVKPKVKPPIVPNKPKRQRAAGNHAGIERSISHEDQRLQVRKPLKLTSFTDDANR